MTEEKHKRKWQNNDDKTLGKCGRGTKTPVATGHDIFWQANGQNEGAWPP